MCSLSSQELAKSDLSHHSAVNSLIFRNRGRGGGGRDSTQYLSQVSNYSNKIQHFRYSAVASTDTIEEVIKDFFQSIADSALFNKQMKTTASVERGLTFCSMGIVW